MNTMDSSTNSIAARETYASLFLRFLRFGLLAWGGPIAQIAMIRQELVDEEKWISNDRFKRVLGVYQALPGPEAHEMCVYFGMTARGRLGGVLAGLGFMLPGFFFMFLLSWLYLAYGEAFPQFRSVFLALQAAVGALIIRAIHRIGSHTLTDPYLWAIAGMAVLAEAIKTPFPVTLVILGVAYLLFKERRLIPAWLISFFFVIGVVLSWQYIGSANTGGVTTTAREVATRAATLPDLFLSGFKSGLLTFGGAYTVIAFLQHDAVEAQAWMTNAQFLDGLALSGIIPAPLIIFATFVGFFAGGGLGAIAMTVAIFLPAFGFTLIGHNFLEKAIANERLRGFLDGVTAAVVGLMAVTTFNLLQTGITSWRSLGIFAVALAAVYLWKAKLAIAFIMAGSGIIGYFVF